MIVDCPACSARFRFPAERHVGKRMRLRCARCKDIFSVFVPADGPHVLVAHSDPVLCKTVAELLQQENIPHQVCHSGDEALSIMTTRAPQVALVDVALPGLFAFEVVDKVRGLPGLEQVKIILLSSVYNKAAYKRRPSSLYGADDYIEKHHIPDDLVGKIRSLSSGEAPQPPQGPQSTIQQQGWDAVNERLQQAEDSEVSGAAGGAELDDAKRLARIVASDIALYHQDKVEEGIRCGSFFELLATEICEGERLFAERFSGNPGLGSQLLRQAFDDLIASRQMAEPH